MLSSSLTSKNIDFEKVKNYIKYLNDSAPLMGYIYNCYAKDRMYFTKDNAMKIDSFLERISLDKGHFTTEEYNFIMKCILYACTKVANVSSTFGAFLKSYKASSTKPIKIENLLDHLIDNNSTSYNMDTLEFITQVPMEYNSICYIDPPYNTRKYSSNYFVLESIAKNDKREISNGITGLPIEKCKSSDLFCSKVLVYNSFRTLFSNIKCKYLFMSYSSESLLTKMQVTELLYETNWTNIQVQEIDHKRFKSNKNTIDTGVLEYIFCATK
jgi:adenine-specific DNA-methyltransferase